MLLHTSLPFPHHDSRADKVNKPSHYRRASGSLTLALPRFCCSPGFPESCTIPKLSRIPAFEMLSTNTPEAKTYARILSAFPNHKQARSHKLSEQQMKYYGSMASSTISGNHGRMEYASKLARTPIFHGGAGPSITHDKSGYDTDARGVEANIPLERLNTLLTPLSE